MSTPTNCHYQKSEEGKCAAADPGVKAVVLLPGGGLGTGQIEEIRQAMGLIRRAGKGATRSFRDTGMSPKPNEMSWGDSEIPEERLNTGNHRLGVGGGLLVVLGRFLLLGAEAGERQQDDENRGPNCEPPCSLAPPDQRQALA